MIRASTVTGLNGKISPTNQSVHQADGCSPLRIVGETTLHFSRDAFYFFLEGLVIENLDIDVLAGIPFMESNDISVRPLKHQVRIGDNTIYTYGDSLQKHISLCDTKAHVLLTVASTTIWPRDYLEVDVPKSILDRDGLLAVEPHLSGSFGVPSILHSVVKKIRIENTGCNLVSLRKHEHLCQVRPGNVSLTDPEPVSSHTDTKNTLRTHVKLSNS